MSLLYKTIDAIKPADAQIREEARIYIDTLTMPRRALGRLLDLAEDLAAMTGNLKFKTARKEIVLLAGDHGIVRQGVCPQPSCVTTQMVRNFAHGGGGINVLAKEANAHVTLVDMGVDADLSDLVAANRLIDCKIARGTADFSVGPAMSRDQATAAIEGGINIAQKFAAQVDVFAVGEMGIGNTSPASAIVSVLAGASDPTLFVGRGAGLDPAKLRHKAQVIRRGITLNRPDPTDGIDLLAKVGGFEIGGIAGVILGAAQMRKPTVIDGFISSAGALIAAQLCPQSCDYMILGHGSAEPGHAAMAKLLGKQPLLDLGMRLGEGTGAALALHLLDAASAIMSEMTTFNEAQVTEEGLS
ncbi:MAG: nicotinate-nucleotide--dimethylbenzimidazole phosphoribosyltransferase [Victivallales bacterium]|jgi:nicotinate-nucleotide--dimethylbenzimidazole phosphoribosyltransferase|nr:nicotinate-nucleotide--dimethylbenzimidazole phosphoribosyltransferase [Victivallales bacterium]